MALVGLLGGSFWLLLIALFIFTAGQAEGEALALREAAGAMHVGDVYNPRVVTIGQEATLADAAHAMLDARSDVAVVAAPGEPPTCVTATALMRVPVRERAATPVGLFAAPLRLVDATSELDAAVALLDEEPSGALGVTREGRLAGTLSREDVMRALALRPSLARPV
jgi:CBS domain-containing protein